MKCVDGSNEDEMRMDDTGQIDNLSHFAVVT